MIVASTDLAPVVSAIIVTWNGKRYALECLASLRHNTGTVPVEVIVVDNNSSDGTPDEIRRQFPTVTLICNDANLGFARANNIGLAAARGRYLCLVNSDVVVPTGCIENMLSFMDQNPGIGMLGPKMLAPGGGIGQSVMRLPTVWNTLCCSLGLHTLFPKSKLFGGFLMNGYRYDSIDDVEVLTGWFWMVRRHALAQVGGLDEQFFMYGEDIDWSYRFRKAGWRVVFYPESEALHYGAASSAQAPTRFYVEMRRANLQYFRKHHGRLGGIGYKTAVLVHELVRIAGHGILYCRASRRPMAAFAIDRSVSSIRWLAGRSQGSRI
jgi:GT2 family glycosyltransferase